MLSADNLRYFLEVSRTLRVKDAARRLGVDQATVSRRISRLEAEIGQRTFDRTPSGWLLTEAGRRLIRHAETLEASLVAAAEDLDSMSSAGLTGALRVITPDGFGTAVLVPGLQRFVAKNPHLSIEVATATTTTSVTARDFDVGVTLERPAQKSVTIQHLAHYELRLYASPQYLEARGTPQSVADLHAHRIIWYIDALLDVTPLRRIEEMPAGVRVGLQSNNIGAHLSGALNGLGIAPLPTYMGAPAAGLVEVLADQFVAKRNYWLVVPDELVHLVRVREFVSALLTIIDANPHLESQAMPGR